MVDNYKEGAVRQQNLKRKLYISISKKIKFLNAKYWNRSILQVLYGNRTTCLCVLNINRIESVESLSELKLRILVSRST